MLDSPNLDEAEIEEAVSDLAGVVGGSVDLELRERLVRLRERSFQLNSEIKLDLPGPCFFKLLAVTDGRNNTVVYDTLPAG